jgi:hypothetical protein
MPFDRSKDLSVHVSTFTSYDFNALTSDVLKLYVCVSKPRHKNE